MSSVPTFSKKAINLICSIGNVNISRKAVKTLEIERNYSDVSNKFTIILIDTPQTSITDLELYMCAGNRNISISYNDNPDSSGFVSYKGQIWDYTSTFVGNIKQLTIAGYVTRTTLRDNSGLALYNIDWNNYFCMRADTKRVWNINNMLFKDQKIRRNWETINMRDNADDRSQYTTPDSRVTVYNNFASFYKLNAITVKIQGPGGSIDLPVPDTFAKMVLDQRTDSKKGKKKYDGDENDSKGRLWGKLIATYVDPISGDVVSSPSDDEKQNLDIFWRAKSDDSIRAFRLVGNPAYIQLNPTKEYYGAGTFLNSDLGVDPSYIVKQLCELEGWKYDNSTIVQTEMVPNSDKFKMNNQSALQFITEVLAPISITPAGYYTNKSGQKVKVTSGAAGFSAWFDSNDVFHFEPLTSLYKQDKRNILLGYNIPNSPVISFQVDTKGTAFYTSNIQEINSIYITTGQQVSSIDTTSQQLQDEYNKVKGHNEVLDEFFGFTYEEVQALYKKTDNSASDAMYLGYGDRYSIDSNTSTSDALATSYSSSSVNYGALDDATSAYVKIISSKVQENLVTSITTSGVSDITNVAADLQSAANKIAQFMITATLNMWGDTRLSPASLIYIINRVKSTNSNEVSQHPTSGSYLILKQVDKVSNDSFTQQLSLIRTNASLYSNINPQNIDYSKGVERLNEKTGVQIQDEKNEEWAVNENNSIIAEYLNLWDEYIRAIERTHPEWKYWDSTYPTIADDFRYARFGDFWSIRISKDLKTVTVYPKTSKAEAQSAWYTKKGATRQTYIKNATGIISVDPALMSWYSRVRAYKTMGKLGTIMLHQPTHLTPQGMDARGMKFDLYDDWDPKGYRYSERGEYYYSAAPSSNPYPTYKQ